MCKRAYMQASGYVYVCVWAGRWVGGCMHMCVFMCVFMCVHMFMSLVFSPGSVVYACKFRVSCQKGGKKDKKQGGVEKRRND